ncbi:hypothetical protein SAMN05421780_102340 [Flexibacter flexilis DSM 6793]|uniref:Uncharacterized protein n=1 Tax=Flexibacter flexilis DSM 6793 TaxID=927664 RepID=A0A1I1G2I3_9BACT|nr:hypothetical protein [Flexibacter flexilis]SFC03380.1 hypothetical protein SAMN05421780_102340 [Flexibacter flexilis DSM 6793]
MQKTFFLLLVLALCAGNIQKSFAQKKKQTTCDIKKQYGDFLRFNRYIEEKDTIIYKATESTVNNKNCLSPLINQNPVFIDYLFQNFSKNTYYQLLKNEKDSSSIQKKGIVALQSDSLFGAVMTELLAKTADQQLPKDTVTFDGLLNIAVKYFSILRISDEGYYVAKICVGLNDIKKTESKRQPFVEAFCFSSIFNSIDNEEFDMQKEMAETLRELYALHLGVDKNERLLRAQGAAYMLLRRNEKLQKLLRKEYEAQKTLLPFVLK